jgi:hypothetical protein
MTILKVKRGAKRRNLPSDQEILAFLELYRELTARYPAFAAHLLGIDLDVIFAAMPYREMRARIWRTRGRGKALRLRTGLSQLAEAEVYRPSRDLHILDDYVKRLEGWPLNKIDGKPRPHWPDPEPEDEAGRVDDLFPQAEARHPAPVLGRVKHQPPGDQDQNNQHLNKILFKRTVHKS